MRPTTKKCYEQYAHNHLRISSIFKKKLISGTVEYAEAGIAYLEDRVQKYLDCHNGRASQSSTSGVRMTPMGPIIVSEHTESTEVVSPAVKKVEEVQNRILDAGCVRQSSNKPSNGQP